MTQQLYTVKRVTRNFVDIVDLDLPTTLLYKRALESEVIGELRADFVEATIVVQLLQHTVQARALARMFSAQSVGGSDPYGLLR